LVQDDCIYYPAKFHNATATAPAPARSIRGIAIRWAALLVVPLVVAALLLVSLVEVEGIVVAVEVTEAVPPVTPVVFGGVVVVVAVVGVPIPDPTTSNVAR
jgi:hypothetical protein